MNHIIVRELGGEPHATIAMARSTDDLTRDTNALEDGLARMNGHRMVIRQRNIYIPLDRFS